MVKRNVALTVKLELEVSSGFQIKENILKAINGCGHNKCYCVASDCSTLSHKNHIIYYL
jgi:hypothetical protein